MRLPLHFIEFPADDPHRARRFWTGVLGSNSSTGDTHSPPYFEVDDLQAALRRVHEPGGELIHHPGARWAVGRDSERSRFGLAARKT